MAAGLLLSGCADDSENLLPGASGRFTSEAAGAINPTDSEVNGELVLSGAQPSGSLQPVVTDAGRRGARLFRHPYLLSDMIRTQQNPLFLTPAERFLSMRGKRLVSSRREKR